MKKFFNFKAFIIALFFMCCISYLNMPVIGIQFTDTYIILFLFFVSYAILCSVFNEKETTYETIDALIGFILAGLIFCVFAIGQIFFSQPFFQSSSFQKLLENKQPIVYSEFDKDISPVDINNIRIIDQDLAEKLGSKLLGENIGLGSVSEVGTFNIQLINKKLYWVAPLLHRDFFKWINSREGTDGYVLVSATDTNDTKIVLKNKIKYQPNAFFGDNIKRHLWVNGYMTTPFTDISFEVNEEGEPFWVISKIKKEIGFNGDDAFGTIIVNPTTGEIKDYSIEETPVWVDRIQPENIITEQLTYYGLYKEGFFNAHFTQENVMTPTEGMSLVFGDDGKSYWYTGMKSKGSDGSTIGFVLINTRTKETKFYKISGASEIKAKYSAEGIVQEKKYTGTFPILYNVLGTPTYILTLKDNEGLIKNIAMVSVRNYSIVGIGDNIKDALRDYKSKLLSNGNSNSAISDNISIEKIISSVERINQDIKNGNAFYYIKVKDLNNIFILDSSLSEEIVLTQKDDMVSINYEKSENQFITVNKFDNLFLSNEKIKKVSE